MKRGRKRHLIKLLCFFVILMNYSCSKQDKIKTPDKNASSYSSITDTLPSGVYIGGYIEDQNTPDGISGALWINDSIVKVSSFKIVTSIQISGKDLYMTGSANGEAKPFYLKNGDSIYIPGAAYIMNLLVIGKDVYALGIDSNYTNKYWINNQSYSLQGFQSDDLPFDKGVIKVFGGNVYIGGSINNEGAIWENGILTLYPNTFGVVSIDKLGNNLYASTINMLDGLKYFKNGQEIVVDQTIHSTQNVIALADTSIAIAYMGDNGNIFININRINTQLNNFNWFVLTTNKNEVYVASSTNADRTLVLWKNGTLKQYPYKGTSVDCMYIK